MIFLNLNFISKHKWQFFSVRSSQRPKCLWSPPPQEQRRQKGGALLYLLEGNPHWGKTHLHFKYGNVNGNTSEEIKKKKKRLYDWCSDHRPTTKQLLQTFTTWKKNQQTLIRFLSASDFLRVSSSSPPPFPFFLPPPTKAFNGMSCTEWG